MTAHVATNERLQDGAALLELAAIGSADRRGAVCAVASAWAQELGRHPGLSGGTVRARIARRVVDVVGPHLPSHGCAIVDSAVPDHESIPNPGPRARRWAGSPAAPASPATDRAGSVERIRFALASLPPGQRAVVSLRDVHGWSLDEVAFAFGLTPALARRYLHAGRTTVWAALWGAPVGDHDRD